MEMGQGTDKDEKGKKGGHTMTDAESLLCELDSDDNGSEYD